MSPARPWTAWWLPKGTIRTISQVGIISFIGARSWTPSLCRARSRLSCSASTLSPTCGRALGFLRTIKCDGLHFRWRNRYTQSYIPKWLNRWRLELSGDHTDQVIVRASSAKQFLETPELAKSLVSLI